MLSDADLGSRLLREYVCSAPVATSTFSRRELGVDAATDERVDEPQRPVGFEDAG